MRISYLKLVAALEEIDDRLVPDPNSSGQRVVYAVEDAALALLSSAARKHLGRKAARG